MQNFVEQLRNGQDLDAGQVHEATGFLLDPEAASEDKAAFLKALAVKGETAGEISAFVKEFLQHAVVPGIDPKSLDGPMLDVVGTGGDKLNLFNVSSTAMFILAAGGVCIVKHGNRGITSKSGGADVLEALGVKIDLPPAELARCVREVGLGFVFAPSYHPAFKSVVAARKILAGEGQRSIFNLLGPLLNPARPPYQLLGVFDERLVPMFAEILKDLGRESAWVVHGTTADGRGMDELSTLGKNKVAKYSAAGIELTELDPLAEGFAEAKIEDLVGGGAVENATILEDILAGRLRGPKREIAVLNAAAGFVIVGKATTLQEGKALAEELIGRGAAHAKLQAVQQWI
ncbi:anthranilate phosphoribosyltransferase [Phragmitibacter flavus]|uniref:Anthranilate phosphoribosyltransferase n=1 Tax=Phragmitibacter flavus TaxID=2576071 RepID=A0A5R8KAI9_9BACT|nr:anthranilate phosphoribosyltransferase [Phragmitibacter flavus]TLD69323.1 anthranilate phosphoribosyltransferase [Phragmitibacter flavus]